MQNAFYIIISLAAVIEMLYIFLMIYFICGLLRSKNYKVGKTICSTSVSVIIAVRNEAANIKECLNSVSLQAYPKELFEVIIIDDSSEDETPDIVMNICTLNPNFRFFSMKNLQPVASGKKSAIEEGIKNSRGNLIVTTDGDCLVSENWLKTIVSFYETEKPKMILAPVTFHSEKNSFQKIQALEFSGLMSITQSATTLNRPIICNGANLAYEKTAFENVSGFSGMPEIASGDDVLLMHKLKEKIPNAIKFLGHEDAVVSTKPQLNFSSFFDQRRRWASKAKLYSDKFSFFVSVLVYLSNFCIPFSLIFALISLNLHNIFLWLIVAGFKCLIDFLFLFLAARKTGKISLMKYFFAAEFFVIAYVSLLAFVNSKTYNWKGRKVK